MLTNYMKHNYKYDANNQRTEDEAQKWNSNKNRWENNLCIRYTYCLLYTSDAADE